MLKIYLLCGCVYVLAMNILVLIMYIFDGINKDSITIPTSKKEWIQLCLAVVLGILLWPLYALLIHVLGINGLYDID